MEAKKEKKDMCLLDAMERIVALAKGSSLSDKFYNKADEHIRFVADKLQLNKQQSVLLAISIDKSDDRSICANEIAEFLQCTTIQILKCMNDINELASREYIYKRQNDRQQTFRVPLAVVEAFTRNEPFIDKAKDNLTLSELMGELESIFDMRSDCELSYK